MLKPIPVEHGARSESKTRRRIDTRTKSSPEYPPLLKLVGLRLVEFFKRSTVFTVEQINELIEGLQRAVLRLQKRKQQLLTEQRFKLNEEIKNDTGKKVKFHGKKLQ